MFILLSIQMNDLDVWNIFALLESHGQQFNIAHILNRMRSIKESQY